jgi:N-acetylglucosaminyl-diphospho-decaprenol L-rhamnosyltransferase
MTNVQTIAPRIAVVVLNYRFPEITLQCLESLSAGSPDDFAIYLVDNSPGEDSESILRAGLARTGRQYRYLASPVNGGFGSGMNIGVRAAIADGFTHVAVLNNDTLAHPDFGIRLREETMRRPNEVLAGLILDTDTHEPSFNIGNLSRWTLEVEHVLDRKYGGKLDFISGCFAVFPVSALRVAGLYREDYFLYAEDTELCLRLKAAGYAFHYCPSIVISHRPGSSADRIGTPKQYYLIRNHTHLVFTRGTYLQKIVYALYMVAVLINQTRHPKIFRMVMSGILDALRGRMGVRATIA